jgi:DNA-binding NarL/FixJ family response regulator
VGSASGVHGLGRRLRVDDDAALFRAGIGRLLADAGFDVTAEVGDAAALLDAVERDPPDAVVVDIRMPPTHTTEGLDAARSLAAERGVVLRRPAPSAPPR